MVFTTEQKKDNNKLNNMLGNNQIFSETNVLPRQLISIISINLFLKSGCSFFLNILLLNSDSKIVCDHIHL